LWDSPAQGAGGTFANGQFTLENARMPPLKQSVRSFTYACLFYAQELQEAHVQARRSPMKHGIVLEEDDDEDPMPSQARAYALANRSTPSTADGNAHHGAASALSSNRSSIVAAQEVMWLYKDPQGNVQGASD
jgi:hypothetical protein